MDEQGEVFSVSLVREVRLRKGPQPMCVVRIGSTEMRMLIDTGASVNILDASQFARLEPRPELKKTTACVYTYEGATPLELQSVMEAVVTHEGRQVATKFHVTQQGAGSLLGCSMAEDLGLVMFARNIHQSHAETILAEFPQLFRGLGCLKGVTIKLHIDKSVQPVALRHRRVPYHLRAKVEEELAIMEANGVIEPVSGPTPWVSPLVLAPKPKQQDVIRICTFPIKRSSESAILRRRLMNWLQT